MKLTCREYTVLERLAKGLTPAEFSHKIGMSHGNACTYRTKLQEKGFRFSTAEDFSACQAWLAANPYRQRPGGFTEMQLEIARAFAKGIKPLKIAAHLGYKESTVASTIRLLPNVLGLRVGDDRITATHNWLVENGVLEPVPDYSPFPLPESLPDESKPFPDPAKLINDLNKTEVYFLCDWWYGWNASRHKSYTSLIRELYQGGYFGKTVGEFKAMHANSEPQPFPPTNPEGPRHIPANPPKPTTPADPTVTPDDPAFT